MFTLFDMLTNKKPALRLFPQDNNNSSTSSRICRVAPPAWLRIQSRLDLSSIQTSTMRQPSLYPHHQPEHRGHLCQMALAGMRRVTFQRGDLVVIYSFCPWVPTTRGLPQFHGAGRTPLLLSPNRKPGLSDINWERSRIKSFGLKEAIRYSYLNDMRFVLLVCALLGTSLWWNLAPEPLLLKPAALSSPDLNLLNRVVRETFRQHVCSSHPQILSPCDCGEPLNNAARHLFAEPRFDPLGIDNSSRQARIAAIAVFFGSIFLSLALAESVSEHGVYVDLTSP